MAITFDPVKRNRALAERGLDFADAERVFTSNTIATFEDDRFDYGETRWITVGRLDSRMVMIV